MNARDAYCQKAKHKKNQTLACYIPIRFAHFQEEERAEFINSSICFYQQSKIQTRATFSTRCFITTSELLCRLKKKKSYTRLSKERLLPSPGIDHTPAPGDGSGIWASGALTTEPRIRIHLTQIRAGLNPRLQTAMLTAIKNTHANDT